MSELQFPKNPTVGQEYDFAPYRYYWDGVKWKTKGIGYNPVNDLRDELEPKISDNESKVFEALRRSYADAGFNLVEGSFEEGGVLLVASDVIITASGDGYSWGGPEFPHNIVKGTDPTVVGSGYVPRTDVDLRQQINTDFPESYGAAGDGVTNDTASISSSISGAGAASYLRKGAKYLVTAISNALGKPFTGTGHVVKSVAGGLEAQNTYADRYQRVTGQENLAAWYRLVYNQHTTPTRQMRIVFSGDSTTAGVGVDSEYTINYLILTGLTDAGMQGPFNTACINNGHSGAHTGQWETTHVSADIAANPDLLVLRWGINDPGWLKDGTTPPLDSGQSYPNRRDITDFATSLRNGLATFRASKGFYTTSILLMMPNSTYDVPNGRDALWYEQMRDVLIQAARDFQCAFIDTYAIMQDSRYLANVLMDDPMPTSGRGIHPNNTMNSIIAGHMLDVIIPKGLRYNLASNKFFSIGGNGLNVQENLTPNYYGAAIYMSRALPSSGWPLNGAAITFRTADEVCMQYHFGYLDADRGKLKVRFGRAAVLGGQAVGWSKWYDLLGGAVQFLESQVSPTSGWSNPSTGGMRISAEGGMRSVEGYMVKSSPSAVAANAIIGTIAGPFRPYHESVYGVATVWNGSAFEQVPVRVATDGNITILKSTSISVQRVYINASYNANL